MLDASACLSDEMVQLERDLCQVLRIHPEQEPIHLFLFSREAVYRQYVGQYFPQVPYRRALYIKERGPGMIFAYSSKELDVDLRHESAHAVLHAALAVVPLWLDEGLAEDFPSFSQRPSVPQPTSAEGEVEPVFWSIHTAGATGSHRSAGQSGGQRVSPGVGLAAFHAAWSPGLAGRTARVPQRYPVAPASRRLESPIAAADP